MFDALLSKLTRREDLTPEESAAAMDEIMEGRASDAAIAALLMGLVMKGERPGEIVGLARAMRDRAKDPAVTRSGLLDMCGTGGDGAGTFNISSVAALVVAGCGVPVAKHGNRAASSRCGSADLFEALGVSLTVPPETVGRVLEDTGLAFLFAPAFHPSMKNAAAVRRAMGLRTAFNLLGPLTNPARPARQVVGVPRPELTELIARALLLLGSERAWVVHAADGIDELSTTGYTKISECRDGAVNTFYLHPSECGLPTVSPAALRGGDVGENATIARAVLAGERGPARDVVLLNAAAALLVAGAAGGMTDGLDRAAFAIDSGAAAGVLQRLAARSRELAA